VVESLDFNQGIGGSNEDQSFAPYEYMIQVIVTDKLAKDKFRWATQWMDFEIVK
jgi:hypothetical protein